MKILLSGGNGAVMKQAMKTKPGGINKRHGWQFGVALATALSLIVPFNAYADSVPSDQPSHNDSGFSVDRLSDFSRLGEISYRKLMFHIYDAELLAEAATFSWERPFALTLTYARKIARDDLVEASLKEMARMNDMEASEYEHFRAPLADCFADVRKGDKITGVSLNSDSALFFFNGTQTCDLKFTGASKAFFSIWLGDNTRSPKKSRRLRGEGKS